MAGHARDPRAGNHEFYGHAYPRLVRKLDARVAALGAARSAPLHVLSDLAVVVGDVRFASVTLWTDFALFGTPVASRAAAEEGMSDHRRIRVEPDYRRWRPADTLMWHRRSVEWLTRTFAEPFAGPTVVVTHHAPSRRSLAPDDADLLAAAAYPSDLDALVGASRAALWVHGHTHRQADYALGATRVVSSPRGYPDERVEGFDPGFVATVQRRVAARRRPLRARSGRGTFSAPKRCRTKREGVMVTEGGSREWAGVVAEFAAALADAWRAGATALWAAVVRRASSGRAADVARAIRHSRAAAPWPDAARLLAVAAGAARSRR